MEEGEKLQKELSDIGAEIAKVSAAAESAKDAEDKRYFREKELMLRKKELMLLEARGMFGAQTNSSCLLRGRHFVRYRLGQGGESSRASPPRVPPTAPMSCSLGGWPGRRERGWNW